MKARLLCVLAASAWLAGCGYKGDLTLPEKPAAEAPVGTPVAKPAEATPPAPTPDAAKPDAASPGRPSSRQ